MSRLTRSEIETMFDDLILAHPIYTPQLRALREQSLSQEAVRDEVIEEAARVADALTSKWHTDYKIGHGPHRASAHREGMSDGAEEVARELRALKREPNAAAQASPSVVPAESNLEFAAGPAPAEPVAEMVKRLNEAAREFARDLAGVSILCGEAAALLSKLGQGWVPVKNRSANYPAAKHLGEWDIIERERADGKLFSFTLPPLPPLPGASDE